MATTDSELVFIRTYDKMIERGRTTTEAGLAAQTAMNAYLQQAVTPVSQPMTPQVGTRLPDLGPVKKRS